MHKNLEEYREVVSSPAEIPVNKEILTRLADPALGFPIAWSLLGKQHRLCNLDSIGLIAAFESIISDVANQQLPPRK